MKQRLTIDALKKEAKKFADRETKHHERKLYGVTDGKAVGTYVEHKFLASLRRKYEFAQSSSAKGLDFPKLRVDMKVTSVKQPQSSCPFKSARQKIFGLGYSLLVFVYRKVDNAKTQKGNLKILHVVYIDAKRTADYQTTTGLQKIIENSGNIDDIVGFMGDRFLPLEDVQARKIAEEILEKPPLTGYLTISNALQWRLQYRRVIERAGEVNGIHRIV